MVRISTLAALLAVSLLGGCGDFGSPNSAPSGSATGGPRPGDSDGQLVVVDELPPPAGARQGNPLAIVANDVLQIDVFGVEKLSRTAQVDPNGDISLALIGNVRASGRSVRDLEQEIARRYAAGYLQSPSISVFVKESSARRVVVDGEVNKAGVYPVPGVSTLLETIAFAGGFRDIADPTKVYVFRTQDGRTQVANYNVSEIRGGLRANPKIYGGDSVMVFSSSTRVAFQYLKETIGVARNALSIGRI